MLFNSIQAFVEQHTLIPSNSTIIIGLSGGPDSLFLLHFLDSIQISKNLTLIAAHLDHEWRSNSDQDAEFCRHVAHRMNISFVSKKISELSADIKFNGSHEEYARRMRRHFFSQVKKEYNGDYIALAHHAQDQQETFFIRLIRGSTLTGLTSMLPQKNEYIRPLLHTNKIDIITYLNQHTIVYLTDPSNDSLDFLRNRIRHLVLPALEKTDTRFEKNIITTITRLQETEQFLDSLSLQLFKTHSTLHNNRLSTNHHSNYPKKHDTAHSTHDTVHSTHDTVHSTHDTVHSTHDTVHSTHDTVHSTHDTVHSLNHDNRYLIDHTTIVNLDPIITYRILMHWIIQSKAPFTPTQKLLEEIVRFLKQPGNKTHQIQQHWSIIKNKRHAYINKNI